MIALWGQYIGDFMRGLLVTAELTGLSLVIALLGGVLLAAGRLSRYLPVRILVAAYVDVMRAVPVLVLLLMAYFGLGQVGISLSGFVAATAALGAFYAALYCEIFRGAVQSIDRGQWEAARALGMSATARMLKVILPQTVLAVLLPATNTASNLIKDTSLVVAIGVSDLMSQAYSASSTTFRPMDMFLLAGLIYFALYLVVSRLLAGWETVISRAHS